MPLQNGRKEHAARRPIDAYREGYEKGQSDDAGGRLAEIRKASVIGIATRDAVIERYEGTECIYDYNSHEPRDVPFLYASENTLRVKLNEEL